MIANRFKLLLLAVLEPFLTVGCVLFILLALAELTRRGSVSLFFDLRVIAVIIFILWIAVLSMSPTLARSRHEFVLVIFALSACLYILYLYTFRFGRLGLFTFAVGIFAAIFVFLNIIRHSSYD